MNDSEDSSSLLDYTSLRESVERMHAERLVTESEKNEVLATLRTDLLDARYIMKHLGVHLAIGGFRYMTMIPLPIGSTLRPLWVLLWRIIETVRRNHARAAIHSLPVFLFAVIPFLGYLSYLIALRKSNERLSLVVANHVCYARRDTNLELIYEERSSLGKWLIRIVVPPASSAFARGEQR